VKEGQDMLRRRLLTEVVLAYEVELLKALKGNATYYQISSM
jgi:hypothetical protein